jgi:uncharacterized membrane protein required for colicin V production
LAPSWILDGALLLLFCAAIWTSARRGFLVSALRFGAWVVSIALAGAFSTALAHPLYDAFAAEPVRTLITKNISGMVNGSDAIHYAQKVIAELPDALARLAEVAGLSLPSLQSSLAGKQFSTQNAAQLLEQNIAAPIAVAAIRMVTMLVLFWVLLGVTRFICRRVEKINRLPVLKQADKLLGAALGLLKGLLLLYILVLLLRAAAALGLGGAVFAGWVESSRLVGLFGALPRWG